MGCRKAGSQQQGIVGLVLEDLLCLQLRGVLNILQEGLARRWLGVDQPQTQVFGRAPRVRLGYC